MADVAEEALAYLERHNVATLATIGSEGVWAAAVFYVNSGFNLYFLSAPHTRHSQNLTANPRTAATIQEDYADWQAIKGIQLEGMVRQIDGDEKKSAITLYRWKYPFLDRATAKIKAAILKVNWYELKPDRFYLIDNSKGFGHRDEIVLPSPK